MLIVGNRVSSYRLVPFHWWVPDIYQGRPSDIGNMWPRSSRAPCLFLAFADIHAFDYSGGATRLFIVFTLVAIGSMSVGNWLALLQTNVKRLLAYSSIAHMGYLA